MYGKHLLSIYPMQFIKFLLLKQIYNSFSLSGGSKYVNKLTASKKIVINKKSKSVELAFVCYFLFPTIL